MDQARWMVVVSVILCMIAALTLLSRNFGHSVPAVAVKNKIVQSGKGSETRRTSQVETFTKSAAKGGWRALVSTRLKHRPPPEHTLAAEAPETARESQLKMETEGRVIK